MLNALTAMPARSGVEVLIGTRTAEEHDRYCKDLARLMI